MGEEAFFDRWFDVREIGGELHRFHTQLAMAQYPDRRDDVDNSDESDEFPITKKFDDIMYKHTHILESREVYIEGLDKEFL